MSDRILTLINSLALRRQFRRKGKAAVKAVTGSTANACAATASQPLLLLHLIDHVELGAQALADTLEHKGWHKFTIHADVRAGDFIVCQDLNHNNMSDHVWFARSSPRASDGKVLCFDNQGDYYRNLSAGSKTPMDYALRLP